MNPQRIQLRRSKGWRKPEGTIVVSRPSEWGNPFRVVPVHRSGPFNVIDNDGDFVGQSTGLEAAREIAVWNFRRLCTYDPGLQRQIRHELAGKDLACWCPLTSPCHADVLLQIANGGTR